MDMMETLIEKYEKHNGEAYFAPHNLQNLAPGTVFKENEIYKT